MITLACSDTAQLRASTSAARSPRPASRSTGGSAPTTGGTSRPTRPSTRQRRLVAGAGLRDVRARARAARSCTGLTVRPRRGRGGRRRGRERVAGAAHRRARREHRRAAVASRSTDTSLRVDGMPVLVRRARHARGRPAPRRPSGHRWAVRAHWAVRRAGGPVEIALLFPVPHRTCVRAAVGDRRVRRAIDVRAICPAPTRSRAAGSASSSVGCRRTCRRPSASSSMRRAATSCSRRDATPGVVSALEDWGFDHEAVRGLGRARLARAPAGATPGGRRRPMVGRARHRRRCRSGSVPLGAARRAGSRARRRAIDILPGFPTDWLGQPLTVDDVPLRARDRCRSRCAGTAPGPRCSGRRPPAWSCARPRSIPAWSSSDAGRGDAARGAADVAAADGHAGSDRPASAVDAPGQFS